MASWHRENARCNLLCAQRTLRVHWHINLLQTIYAVWTVNKNDWFTDFHSLPLMIYICGTAAGHCGDMRSEHCMINPSNVWPSVDGRRISAIQWIVCSRCHQSYRNCLLVIWLCPSKMYIWQINDVRRVTCAIRNNNKYSSRNMLWTMECRISSRAKKAIYLFVARWSVST